MIKGGAGAQQPIRMVSKIEKNKIRWFCQLKVCISFLDHQDTTNHQSVRHHLQRSQSLGFASTQSLNSIQKSVYPDNNHPLSLKRKSSSTERPPAAIPFKISRLNSSPATSTITSSNYVPNDATASSSLVINSNHQFLTPPVIQPAQSFKIEIKTPDGNNVHANKNFQISYCMDSANKTNHINSTSSIQDHLKIPTAHATMEPVMKLDYSNLTLPMTSAIPATINSSSSSLSTTPSPFKIDLSNFSPMTPQQIQLSSQNQQLDENYDDL